MARDALELAVEAEAAYELAVADAVFAREAWVKAGSPLEQRTQGVHPLRRALVEADDRAARRRKDLVELLPRLQRGRPVGAVSAIDRSPPALTLRKAGTEPISFSHVDNTFRRLKSADPMTEEKAG